MSDPRVGVWRAHPGHQQTPSAILRRLRPAPLEAGPPARDRQQLPAGELWAAAAAKKLGCSRERLHAQRIAGRLKGRRLMRRHGWTYAVSELERFLREHGPVTAPGTFDEAE